MSAAHYSLVNGATASATANALVKRGASGEIAVAALSCTTIAANGNYKVALFLYRVPLEELSVVPTLVASDGTSHPAKVKLLELESGSTSLF